MKRRLTIVLLSLVFVAAFWFLGVDSSWFVEKCPDCFSGRDIFQYRVFTIPIYQQMREHDTAIRRIAADLGAECRHPKLWRRHEYRFWGLVICTQPSEVGLCWLQGVVEWYDGKASAAVKEMARINPSLRDEFSERAIKNHDANYIRAFCQRVIAARDQGSAATQGQ